MREVHLIDGVEHVFDDDFILIFNPEPNEAGVSVSPERVAPVSEQQARA